MKDLYKNKYKISSARLQHWDYGDNGLYFITICTAGKERFFGEIIADPIHISEAYQNVETRCIASLHTVQDKHPYLLQTMKLNDLGAMVQQEWLKTPLLRPDMNLALGEFIIMPNHFHAIIHIGENEHNTAKHYEKPFRTDTIHHTFSTNSNSIPTKNQFGPQAKNLASIIRGFKSSVTNYARKNNIPFNWQARFHDHIITSHTEYLKISDYIVNNPIKWQDDKFYVK